MFKEMQILSLYSQYIFSLSMYVVKSKHSFIKNWEIHSHNTRTARNIHMPAVNIIRYKKELIIRAVIFTFSFEII
jgi:hypothetical protein